MRKRQAGRISSTRKMQCSTLKSAYRITQKRTSVFRTSLKVRRRNRAWTRSERKFPELPERPSHWPRRGPAPWTAAQVADVSSETASTNPHVCVRWEGAANDAKKVCSLCDYCMTISSRVIFFLLGR